MPAPAFEFTDRYQALGIPRPDPGTVCLGHCEGTGFVPIKDGAPESGAVFDRLWHEAHARSCSLRGRLRQLLALSPRRAFQRCDGWHFVVCPDCGGSGKRPKAST